MSAPAFFNAGTDSRLLAPGALKRSNPPMRSGSTPVHPDPGDAGEDVRGTGRLRRVWLTAGASLAGRAAGILVTLVTIPLTLRHLGPERYGLWIAIVSTSSLLAFADLGLGYGLLNRSAAAFGTDRPESVRHFVSNAFLMLGAVALAGIALIAGAAGFLPWGAWFPGTDPAVTAECGRAVLVLAVAFMVGLPFTIWQRTLGAAQRGYWNPLGDLLGAVLSLGLLLAVIARGGGLVALAGAAAAGPLAAALGGWLSVFVWARSDLRPRPSDWNASTARSLMGEGACFFVLQLSALVLVSGSSLILLHRVGAQELAEYSIVAKLFQLGPQLATLLFAPLWPAYGEALARGDVRWAHATLRRSVFLSAGLGIGVAVLLSVFASLIIRLWTGLAFEPSPAQLAGLA